MREERPNGVEHDTRAFPVTLDLDAPAPLDTASKDRFWREGYCTLGRIDDPTLESLRQAIDGVMDGTADVPFDSLLMQLDSSTGVYTDLGPQTRGFKGASRNYRKIQDLELEPTLRAYLTKPLFESIARYIYGTASIACFRAMFMNKPAAGGTVLAWHQDRWRSLDRDPVFTIWTALDDTTPVNGCLEVIPRSHGALVNPSDPSAHLTAEQCATWDQAPREALPVRAGTVLLLHNWLLHRSGVNASSAPRRAFSVCYMDGRTKDRNGTRYRQLFAAPDDA